MKTLRLIAAVALPIIFFAGSFPVAAHAQTFQTLYSFFGAPDGAEPFQSNLILVSGALLGTTGIGGTFNAGAVFKLTGTGRESVLYSFSGGADGNQPSSGLIRDSKGNLYGTTFFGGNTNCVLNSNYPAGCGTVYKLDSANHFSVLYTFQGRADGAWPQGLVQDSAGNLYGVTFYGGDLNCPLLPGLGCGVVFKISSTGVFSLLYTFRGGTDGAVPEGFLTLHGAAVYGATQGGGVTANCGGFGCGVLFAVSTTTGTEKPLFAFTGGSDGGGPMSQVLFDKVGNLYGTAFSGGNAACSNNGSVGCGVLFQLSPSGAQTVLHTFQGAPNDGANPTWGLTLDASGNTFGTTIYGGNANLGTVFEFSSIGRVSSVHSFTGPDGQYPQSGLLDLGKTGLFSNTVQGGNLSCNSPNGCGTVFRIVP
jgi:uncharacterized repeat protein (TIGR03803 family)